MLEDLEDEHRIPYGELSKLQKSRSHRKIRKSVLQHILMISGSTDIIHQEAVVHDCFRSMHPGFSPYSYCRLKTFLAHLARLEQFDHSPEQNMTNRYKYTLAKALINRLSGYSSSGQGGSSSSRKMFLKCKFPIAFKMT